MKRAAKIFLRFVVICLACMAVFGFVALNFMKLNTLAESAAHKMQAVSEEMYDEAESLVKRKILEKLMAASVEYRQMTATVKEALPMEKIRRASPEISEAFGLLLNNRAKSGGSGSAGTLSYVLAALLIALAAANSKSADAASHVLAALLSGLAAAAALSLLAAWLLSRNLAGPLQRLIDLYFFSLA